MSVTDIAIEEFTEARRAEAIALVDRIFPNQSPIERLGLRLFRTKWQWILDLAGIAEGQFWLAVRSGQPIGTVGLYSRPEDAHEAAWLAWFCVAPEARGLGVGRALLAHAVAVATQSGCRFVRLYTSTDPNEAAAQNVYERHGFRTTRIDRPWSWRASGLERIIRERKLSAPNRPDKSNDQEAS